MRRPSDAVAVGALILLSTLVLGTPSASALPPASGLNCSSSWVNNPAAMACFIQGQEDVSKGVAHPHYVACLPGGEVMCCVDNLPNGGQNCEEVRTGGGRRHIEDLQMSALLLAQQTILAKLAHIVGVLNDLQATIAEPNVGSAPDYMPLPMPRVAGPAALRRINADLSKLQVLVYNQGAADPLGKKTETRVTFTTTSGPVQLPSPDDLNTSTLVAGGSQLLEFAIPSNCTSTTTGAYCDFTVGVDAGNAVAESKEANNTAPGTCFQRL